MILYIFPQVYTLIISTIHLKFSWNVILDKFDYLQKRGLASKTTLPRDSSTWAGDLAPQSFSIFIRKVRTLPTLMRLGERVDEGSLFSLSLVLTLID